MSNYYEDDDDSSISENEDLCYLENSLLMKAVMWSSSTEWCNQFKNNIVHVFVDFFLLAKITAVLDLFTYSDSSQ